MKYKNSFTILLLFIINYVYSQESVLKTEKINEVFNYDYEIYFLNINFDNPNSKPPYPCHIDTFNVCRVKKSGIKRLTIYYFPSSSDSTIRHDIHYTNNGLIKSIEPSIGWFMYADINPDSVSIDCSTFRNKKASHNILKKDKVIKTAQQKEIYKYDSLGYLTSYTEITTGLINRWMTRNIGGVSVKHQTLYEYDNNYKRILIRHNYWDKVNSRKCKELSYDYIICEFDDFGNILSELKYKHDANGQPIYVSGFKYLYVFEDK